MRKKTKFVLLFFLLLPTFASTQTLIRITTGAIVNDGGNSSGCSWVDYDNDGDLDLFVANGFESNENNFLYKNNGDPDGSGQVTFTKITAGDMVTNGRESIGITWGDYDNNGFLDLFVTNWANQSNYLYRSLGNQEDIGEVTFEKILSGDIVNDSENSFSASWIDYDNDGDLDLLVVGNGVNSLYENKGLSRSVTGGEITFTNTNFLTADINSRGCSWGDYDNDGDLDLFVANVGENYLYRNDASRGFYRIKSGEIISDRGTSYSASWGDYDNDGDLDLFVSNGGHQEENNFLYENNGPDGMGQVIFTKITTGPVVNDGGRSRSSSWGDYDNDGDLDLFVANGRESDENNFFYQNNGPDSSGNIIFSKAQTDAGISRGCSWGDYDNDGDLDLFVANYGDNFLYENQGNQNNWINIHCVGTASNSSAIGARVRIKATIKGVPVWQMREISGQTGSKSQNSLNVEFGLGDAAIIDSIRIRWPSGIVQDMANEAVNRFIQITEPQFVRLTLGEIANNGGFSYGCSWGDYDNDGDQDLFVSNAGRENNFLYENNGDPDGFGQVTFTKITTGIIVNDGGNSQSSSWGDFNNDGNLDLFITNSNENFLYQNNGNDGSGQVSFTKIDTGAIVNDGGNSKGCSWGDYDNDGDLDLFVANSGVNFLYENKGDPTGTGQTRFVKIEGIDIVTDAGFSSGCNWVDYDGDGDLDLFVTNIGDNFLYENTGPDETGLTIFLKIKNIKIVTDGGSTLGSSWGDFDNDGDLDLFVTNLNSPRYNLYQNDGADFSKINSKIKTADVTGTFFGSSWGDYDNDGDLDLFVTNSGNNNLFRNDGAGSFTSITDVAIFKDGGNSNGCSLADYDGNGALDLFVSNIGGENNFLYQTARTGNHWLNIQLKGRFSNTSAIGAKVFVFARINGFPVQQMREISAQTGYFSQNSLNAEFGLGDADLVDSILVEWPTGAVNRWDNVTANQFSPLEENNRPKIANKISVRTLSINNPQYSSQFVQDLDADPAVFSDADGDTISYQAVSSDTKIAMAHIVGDSLTVILVGETAGRAEIKIIAEDGRVDDGKGDTETTTFEINRPPLIFFPIPSQTFFLEDTSVFIADLNKVFVDFDGDNLDFSSNTSDSAFAFAQIDFPNLYVMPGNSSGPVLIKVTANDNRGGSNSIEFKVTNKLDNEKPTVSKPILKTTLLVNGPPLTKNLYDHFIDEDGDPLDFKPHSTNNSVAIARIIKDTTLVVEPQSTGNTTITVRAFDPVNEEASLQFDVEVLPSFRPEITHTQITTHYLGLPVSIEATITDDEDSLLNTILYYRIGGVANFDSDTLDDPDQNGHFIGSIPATAVTNRGVEYYIYAEDVHGVKRRVPKSGVNSVQVRVDAGLTKTSPQPGGNPQKDYRLISIPLDLDNKDPESVLVNNLGEYDKSEWRFIQWVTVSGDLTKPLEYPNTTPMEPGKAFWLIVKNTGKIINTGSGNTVSTSKRFEIELNRGWSLIGNPFNFPTFAEDTLSDGSTFSLRTYDDSGWSDVLDPSSTVLMPFEGYAVNSENTSALFIKSNPYNTVSKKVAKSENNTLWSIRIKAQCQNARDNNNMAAVVENSSREWDRLDSPEPPGVGKYVSVYFPHPDWERFSKRFSTDTRPEPSKGEEWEFEIKTNINDIVNLSFEGLETVPSEYNIWLVDKSLKITNNLRERENYSVAGGTENHPKRLSLVVGKQDFLQEKFTELQLIPSNYVLSQNFPNPFNPSTTIRYGLPSSSRITLTVYNLLGKKVKVLVNNELKEAGYHAAAWDGRNTEGNGVVSGVYFIRMTAGNFVQTRKIVLIE